MDKFSGKCIGGPWDKKLLVHWERTQKLYRPMVGFMMVGDPPVIPVTIGEYRLNDYGYWHWWPTEEGKAMDKLMGPATA